MASIDSDKTTHMTKTAGARGRDAGDPSPIIRGAGRKTPLSADGDPSAGVQVSAQASPYAAYLGSPDTHIGATQPIALRKGLFDGISVAQVIAASAAAATSMLLASKIGIAGSVIGAAVSSMVTVICSQLYRNALDASAQKLKAKQAYNAQVRGAQNIPGNSAAQMAPGSAPVGGPAGDRVLTARIAPIKLQARAAAERSATKRKVAVVSALIAALAVALSAGLVMLGTAGEGLGTKTPPIFSSQAPAAQAPANPADEVAPTDGIEAAEPSENPSTGAGDAATAPMGDEGTSAQQPDAGKTEDTGGSGGAAGDANGSGANGDGAQMPDAGPGAGGTVDQAAPEAQAQSSAQAPAKGNAAPSTAARASTRGNAAA